MHRPEAARCGEQFVPETRAQPVLSTHHVEQLDAVALRDCGASGGRVEPARGRGDVELLDAGLGRLTPHAPYLVSGMFLSPSSGTPPAGPSLSAEAALTLALRREPSVSSKSLCAEAESKPFSFLNASFSARTSNREWRARTSPVVVGASLVGACPE